MAEKTFFKPQVDHNCERCKGKCWDPKSNIATQENALKMFGIIPNNCVIPQIGAHKCPYA